MVAGWNDTAAAVPRADAAGAVRRRGRRGRPDAVAVVCGDAVLVVWGAGWAGGPAGAVPGGGGGGAGAGGGGVPGAVGRSW